MKETDTCFELNDNLQDVGNFGENRIGIGITTTYLTMYLNNYEPGVILLCLMTSLKGKYYRFKFIEFNTSQSSEPKPPIP